MRLDLLNLYAVAGPRLDPAFAEKLLNFIIAEVIRHHERLADRPVASGGSSEG